MKLIFVLFFYASFALGGPTLPQGIAEPTKQIGSPEITYPPESKMRGEQGRVTLKIRILADGSIGEAKVDVGSGASALDIAALESVKKMKFMPAKSPSGESVASWVKLPVIFKLTNTALNLPPQSSLPYWQLPALYRTPSVSMEPTLPKGNWFISQGCRDVECKIERGTIVVFKNPKDFDATFAKRVIGLPGDKVKYENKRVAVNDAVSSEFYLGESTVENVQYEVYREIAFGRDYRVLKQKNVTGSNGDGVFVVPKDQIFVLGDNRDNSKDSRYIGSIPISNIVGTYAEGP